MPGRAGEKPGLGPSRLVGAPDALNPLHTVAVRPICRSAQANVATPQGPKPAQRAEALLSPAAGDRDD